MSLKIIEEDGEYWLYSVSHSPVNLQPFTNPIGWKDFAYSIRQGRMRELCGFELDKEYDLEIHKDFIISERINCHGKGDKIWYSTKLYMRKEKILRLCQQK